MNKKIKAFVNVHILFLFYSWIMVVSKIASKYDFLSIAFVFLYGIELIMIAVYAFFWQRIIKKLPLVVAYPNKSVVILWTLLWSYLIFNEPVNINQVAGVLMIVLGVILVVKNDE